MNAIFTAGRSPRRRLERPQELGGIGPGSVVALTVDEEGRRAVDPASHATAKVAAHLRRERPLLELPADARRVESQARRVADEVVVRERALVLVQRVMHL